MRFNKWDYINKINKIYVWICQKNCRRLFVIIVEV